MTEVKIGKRLIGMDHPPLVLAEVGINHEGSYEKAIQLIDAAKASGAEAIKFQTHITHHEMLETDMKPGDISNERLWDIIKRCELTEKEESSLFQYCRQKDILFLSTPFSREASDRLETLGVEGYKIGSGECNNYPLIKHIAKKGKPIILSTGMNDLSSIRESVNIIKSYNCPLIIMHCTSMYPTPYSKVRLGAITHLQKEFPKIPIGLSDHSLGSEIARYSTIAGARVFEKHIALQNQKKGLDLEFSLKGKDFKTYIKLIRDTYELVKNENYQRSKNELENKIFRRSIYAIKDIKKGEKFSKKNIQTFRPNIGLCASYFLNLLGRKSPVKLRKNYPLPKSLVSKK